MSKTFTSSRGVVLNLRPVSQFKIDSLRGTKKDIPAPTYPMNVVGGGIQEVPLDEEIAKNTGRLDEWTAYVELRDKKGAEYSKKFLQLLVWDGVDVDVPGPESEWQTVSDHFGIELPTNPIERKLKYVYDEVLGAPDDLGDLIADILAAGALNQEAVENLRASFRSRIPGKAGKRMSPKRGQVEDAQPGLDTPGDGPLLEPVTIADGDLPA